MLNGKYVSLKNIIAKVYRDLQLKEEGVFTDIIEWAAEALDFIHVYDQYESKTHTIAIQNYKGEIPCDFIALESAEYNGYQLRSSKHSFGPQSSGAATPRLPYRSNREVLESSGLLVDPTKFYAGSESFKFDGGFCKTSFETGYVTIQYQALPTDCDGYPLIPDNQAFKEALFWFITAKYLYPKVLHKEIEERFYTDAFEKWQWYCGQAGAEAMMPDLNTLENLKRAYLSLRLNPNQFATFFNDLNKNY